MAQIHASGLAKHGDVDYEAIVKLAEGFNGADMRNICTEAGMFAIRDERDYTIQEDFMKACCCPPDTHLACAVSHLLLNCSSAAKAAGRIMPCLTN